MGVGREVVQSGVMQRGIIGESGFGSAGVVGAGAEEHRAEKTNENKLPLLQIGRRGREGRRRSRLEKRRDCRSRRSCKGYARTSGIFQGSSNLWRGTTFQCCVLCSRIVRAR